MILDRLDCWQRYAPLHNGFAGAFQALADSRTAALTVGRHTVDGDRLYLIIGRDAGRGREGAKLESHRRYIDIQLTLNGPEEIGWLPLADCGEPDQPYAPERDIAFYSARPRTWFTMPPGTFAIFYPDDAHAPLAGQGELHKAVAKVAVEWH